MFSTNEGGIDRFLRVVIGAGLILWFMSIRAQYFGITPS